MWISPDPTPYNCRSVVHNRSPPCYHRTLRRKAAIDRATLGVGSNRVTTLLLNSVFNSCNFPPPSLT